MTGNPNKIDKNSSQKEMIEINCEEASKIFKEIKQNMKSNTTIICSEGQAYMEKDLSNLSNSNQFMDKIKYYRIKKGISQRKLATDIGIHPETYRQYELQKKKIHDYRIAEKIVKILEVEEKVKLPEELELRKKYPIEKIKKVILQEGKTNFAKKTGISESTIRYWLKDDVKEKNISIDNYRKIIDFLELYI